MFSGSLTVFVTYTSEVCTGHTESDSLNALKKTSLGGPDQHVLSDLVYDKPGTVSNELLEVLVLPGQV